MGKKIDRGFARKLREEIEIWEQEGLVSPILKDQILAYYKMKARLGGPAGTGKLITALSILGSVLAGVGVILFVAANWSAIPVGGKLAVIFIPMAASYTLGYLLRYERGDFPGSGPASFYWGRFSSAQGSSSSLRFIICPCILPTARSYGDWGCFPWPTFFASRLFLP